MTLIIASLPRYEQVIEAYLSGLEDLVRRPRRGPDARLERGELLHQPRGQRGGRPPRRRTTPTSHPLALHGKAAIANAKLAYPLFQKHFSGERWDAAAPPSGPACSGHCGPATGAKNPAYSDAMYVDQLIGPDTVNTMPDATITAFLDHGTVARRVDVDVADAQAVWAKLPEVGVDMDDVADQLEREAWPASPQRSTSSSRRSKRRRPASGADTADHGASSSWVHTRSAPADTRR